MVLTLGEWHVSFRVMVVVVCPMYELSVISSSVMEMQSPIWQGTNIRSTLWYFLRCLINSDDNCFKLCVVYNES